MKNKNILETNEELLNYANEEADKIAKELGYEDGQDLVDSVNAGLKSSNPADVRAVSRDAGKFTAKLSLVVYEQVIYKQEGIEKVYSWVDKFDYKFLEFGNTLNFINDVVTTATTYDPSLFVPNKTTDPLVETFSGGFLKADKTLSETSYQYKKSLSIKKHDWAPFFASGKLGEMISTIITRMNTTYTLFKAQKLQGLIKNLASGSAQVSIANAGTNGKDLKLKKIDGTAPDTFAAMIELLEHINNLTMDVNKTNIGSDSTSITPISLEDLVIIVPKKLKTLFENGILTRLPNASKFQESVLFSSDRVIPAGVELQPIQNSTTKEVDVVQGETPFIDNNTIVVLDKNAIKHCFMVRENESQYFAENMIEQLTIHIWGFFVILPFAKGFVYKNTNLMTAPN